MCAGCFSCYWPYSPGFFAAKIATLIARQKDYFLPSTGANYCGPAPVVAVCGAATEVFVAGLLMVCSPPVAGGCSEVFAITMGGLMPTVFSRHSTGAVQCPGTRSSGSSPAVNGVASYLLQSLYTESAPMCACSLTSSSSSGLDYQQGLIALLSMLFYLGSSFSWSSSRPTRRHP